MARTSNVRSIGDRGTAPAAEAPKVDEQVIEAAARETSRMGTADRVHFWDKKQGVKVADASGKLMPGPDVIVCGQDRAHGPLTIHGQGNVLMCMAHKGGAPCTYSQPVSV